jgi:hypothetical protein
MIHTDQRPHYECASEPWNCTLIYIISTPGSSQPCSHLHLQRLGIILIRSQLCSMTSCAHKARGMLLFLSRPLLLHSDWHLLACTKEDVLCAPILKHCGDRSRHQDPWFLHTSRVYSLVLCLSRHGLSAFLRFSLHRKGGVIDNHT